MGIEDSVSVELNFKAKFMQEELNSTESFCFSAGCPEFEIVPPLLMESLMKQLSLLLIWGSGSKP